MITRKVTMPENEIGDLKLLEYQFSLYQALVDIDKNLARMYLGSLKVLNDEQNPERIALASHNIRELMEKLSTNVGVLQPEDRLPYVRNEANRLENCWKNNYPKTKTKESGEWNGAIDKPLMRILRCLEKFINFLKNSTPPAEQSFRNYLRRNKIHKYQVPESLEDWNVDKWIALSRYFIKISHHNATPELEDFQEELLSFEQFLLGLLKPQPLDDRATLDRIIKEAESNA